MPVTCPLPPLLHPGFTQGKRCGWEAHGSCRSPTSRRGLRWPTSTRASAPDLRPDPASFQEERAPQCPPPTSAPGAGALARSRESESTRPPESTRVTAQPCCLGWILGSQLLPGPFFISTSKVTKAVGLVQRTTCPKESHSEARDEVLT